MKNKTIAVSILIVIVAIAGGFLTYWNFYTQEFSRFNTAMDSVQLQAIRITNMTIIRYNATESFMEISSEAEIRVFNPTQYPVAIHLFDTMPLFNTTMGEWAWPQGQISTVSLTPNSTSIINTYWGGYGTSIESGSYIYSYLSNRTGIWLLIGSMGTTLETKADFKTNLFETWKYFNPDNLSWENLGFS
jgi:hypothetical protein